MADGYRSPRLNGAVLTNVARFARTGVGAAALQHMMRRELRIDRLTALPAELRGDIPLDTNPHPGRPPRQVASADLPLPKGAGWAPTSVDIAEAYRTRRTTPTEVVARALEEARRLAAMTPSVGPLYEIAEAAMSEAEASTRRWRDGHPLGQLDGVPWVVKEQTGVRGLARRSGTTYVSADPMTEDATAVARMRAAGAITLGTTPMTEHGMTPNGANSKRTMPRNPHGTDHIAGGSSTGTGVAVATGLVPFGLGCDGGGSIRIPACMNGVFGIKATWGRVSRSGDTSVGSVSHVGPLASSTYDLATILELVSGHDPPDPQTFNAPALRAGTFLSGLSRGVRGLVIGVAEEEIAEASNAVQRALREALAALEKEGAILQPIKIELAKHAMSIGYVCIATEARGGLSADWKNHADEMGPDLQISMSVVEAFSAVEYMDALRLRGGLRRELAKVLQTVDLVALPSTIDGAPKVSDRDMKTGFLDPRVLNGLCRFMFMANLTGLPAASMPIGVDSSDMPIGLQLVGDAWDEPSILAASAHLERIGVARPRKPKVAAQIMV